MIQYFSFESNDEFSTRERCSIVELINNPDIPDLSVARCRVKPGVRTELHSLKNTQETYVVVQGQGVMSDGRDTGKTVTPMDCILIPAGYPQQIFNNGKEDLIFLVLCTGRFVESAYTPHEQPDAIDPVYP